MKKITLALCACAFALTGLLASCSNEAPATSVNYTDVGSYKHSHVYAVKGTITTTNFLSQKTDALRNPSETGKETSQTTVITKTIEDGGVCVMWDTNENKVSNLETYSIEGKLFGTIETKTTSKIYDEAQPWNKQVEKGEIPYGITIYSIDDEYYLAELDSNTHEVSKLTKLDSYAVSDDDPAFDGEFGGEFTLAYTITIDHGTFEEVAGPNFEYDEDYTKTTSSGYSTYLSWKNNVEKYDAKATETTEVKLTFYPLQDYDPEAEVEDDEE